MARWRSFLGQMESLDPAIDFRRGSGPSRFWCGSGQGLRLVSKKKQSIMLMIALAGQIQYVARWVRSNTRPDWEAFSRSTRFPDRPDGDQFPGGRMSRWARSDLGPDWPDRTSGPMGPMARWARSPSGPDDRPDPKQIPMGFLLPSFEGPDGPDG